MTKGHLIRQPAAATGLAAARSRSRENNTQLFSYTLAPLRYPTRFAGEGFSGGDNTPVGKDLAEASQKYGEQAKAMEATYIEGQDVEKYDGAYSVAYEIGKAGGKLDYVMNSPATAYLSESQRRIAYETGAAARNNATNTRSQKGKVIFENDAKGIKKSSLNERQKTGLKTLEVISKATGVDFHIFASYVNKDGVRVYKNAEGKELKAPNGWYDSATGDIYIDINAGNMGEGTILFTVSHELTHFIKQWSPEKFNVLAGFLVEQYEQKGASVEELVNNQLQKMRANGNENASYDDAFEEYVADSMSTMLTSENAAEVLAELKSQDASLWEKIKEFITDLVEKLKKAVEAYKGFAPDSIEGQTVAQMTDAISELERLFIEGVSEASENYQGGRSEAGDEIKYSERYQQEIPNLNVLKLTSKVKSTNFKANEKVYFDNISDEVAARIKEILNIDVKGFKVAIEARQIEHIIKDHGEKGKSDHSMANDNDIAKMEYAIKNADSIELAGRTQAYSHMVDGYNRTAQTVLYEKNIGEKSYYVVQAIVDTNAKTLYIVSAYIGKPSIKKGASQLIDKTNPDATPKNGSVVAPNKSISQESDSVNRKFSERDPDAVSNRTLLVNALESTVTNDIEKGKLAQYKAKIELMNAEEAKLRDIRGQIKELSFAKGPRDTAAIKELQNEAAKTANRINTYDRQLLNLESTQALKNVLEREKAKAYKRAEAKGKEDLARYREKAEARVQEIKQHYQEARARGVEGRHKSEMREKIKSIKDKFISMLKNPTDRQYVPKEFVDAVVDVCQLVDTSTELYKNNGDINKAQQARNETLAKLLTLKDEYKKLGATDEFSYEYDEEISDYLDRLRKDYTGKNIADMTLDELRELYEILRSISDTLADARKIIGISEAATIYEYGDGIIAEQAKIAKSQKDGKFVTGARDARNAIIDQSLNPLRNINRMSGYDKKRDFLSQVDGL